MVDNGQERRKILIFRTEGSPWRSLTGDQPNRGKMECNLNGGTKPQEEWDVLGMGAAA